VDIDPVEDERGFFARAWCREEFQAFGLTTVIAQCNISFNKRRGTLRGMHYQAVPHGEVKLIRCTRGAIHDVLLDLRAESPTFCRWFAIELTADDGRMVYVPAGFAHGFQVLADQSEVFYQISEPYRPDMTRGVRWNDPAFQIEWPIGNPILSARDRDFADFSVSLAQNVANKKEA
jgi:dTDP-4-dehydrorhamnose 3,5-epimerase